MVKTYRGAGVYSTEVYRGGGGGGGECSLFDSRKVRKPGV